MGRERTTGEPELSGPYRICMRPWSVSGRAGYVRSLGGEPEVMSCRHNREEKTPEWDEADKMRIEGVQAPVLWQRFGLPERREVPRR